eukprot:IDg18073t1
MVGQRRNTAGGKSRTRKRDAHSGVARKCSAQPRSHRRIAAREHFALFGLNLRKCANYSALLYVSYRDMVQMLRTALSVKCKRKLTMLSLHDPYTIMKASMTKKPRTSNGVHQAQPRNGTVLPESAQLALCAAGIYACYLNYGLLQEKIYSVAYGVAEERFRYSTFLLCVQTATNAMGARVALAVMRAPAGRPTPRAMREYAVVALSYLSAMWFSFTALRHMSYPMQALGKSCKMVPVMLLGILIRGRRYAARDFACVGLITAGVALFSYKPRAAAAAPTSSLGIGLLLLSLFCDGITGPLQERLVVRHQPSTHQLMLWQNACACAWLLVALVVSGEGAEAVRFVARYPAVLANVMLFSTVSALGQNFIFYTVRHFSALAVTTITTTRKMFTVLLSIVIFKHQVVPRQWAGLVLVFTAIAWEAVAKSKKKAAAA